MITSCESGLKHEWGAFFFNERKENSQSFIMDVTCSYRMDLSYYIELNMLVDHGVVCVCVYIYIYIYIYTHTSIFVCMCVSLC